MTMARLRASFMIGVVCLLIMIPNMVVTTQSSQEEDLSGTKKVEDPQEDSKDEEVMTAGDTTGHALGRVIVGTEAGWHSGRIEETQLVASAKHHNYDIQIQSNGEVPCEKESEKNEDYILIYLPRAEGIIASPAEDLSKALQEASADIILPFGGINALVGRARSIQTAAKALGVTSIAALAQEFHARPKLRTQYNVKSKESGTVFHVLDDLSSIGNENLEMVEHEDKYELQVNGRAPCVILASPESAHARALLLAISDYLVGTHRPKKGCVSCVTVGDGGVPLNVSHLVMVGVFITKPQPFLVDTFSALLRHGLEPSATHFFIYNEIEEYKGMVEAFVTHLREKGEVRNITVLQASGNSLGVGNVKNMAMRECLRLGCKWYLNVDSYTFMNPQIMAVLLSLGHPVIAPAFRVQTWMPATFWREVDAVSSIPTYSWDHAKILGDPDNMSGYWHASCIRGFYAVRHDVLARLSEPYTHAHKVPLNHPHPDPDLAFCAALREEGIPLIATSAFPDSGVLLNLTHYNLNDDNIHQFVSNPVMWKVAYVHKDLQEILTLSIEKVKRPCHEVYEIPVFNSLFGYDLVSTAKKVNKWSPGLKEDPRKELGIEPIPTVDQWFSQLGLKGLLDYLYQDIFVYLQELAFPPSNPGILYQALVARFQPGEMPGLPQHHDSGIITFYLNLTPKDDYEGGEVEFPMQQCRVKSEVGHLLMFPSRLTHPKIFHNVTKGVLHKAIILVDEAEINNPSAKKKDQ